MPIIGYNISSIVAERKNFQAKKIDINSTPKVNSVFERNLTFPIKQDALAISFEFNTTYNPDVGEIKICGELLYSDKNIKKISDYWNKKNQLPDPIDIQIKNFLFRKCLTLGISISENLQLPPPVMFPIVTQNKEENTNYIG